MALLSPVRNAAFALFFVAILAYGASFAWHLLINFDLLDLIYEVNSDDSFYYFKIAQHLAEGKFSTFDGGITRTNGYHPIWLLLITPFYWVFDSVQALFAIKTFEILLVAGGVALIALAARLAHLPWILLIGVLPPLYMAGDRGLIQGMEAAAALFWLGLLFLALVLWARKPVRWFWLLAAVLFSLPWVRLELAAVSFAAAGALYLLGSRMDASRIARLKPMLAAVAGLLVCFAWNWLAFGGPVPVSGLVRRSWSVLRWQEEGGYSLERNLQESLQIHAFDNELPLALGICVGFLLLLWLARRFWHREYWPLLAFLVGAFSVAAGHLGKFVQTVLAMHPDFSAYVHYFVPGYLMMALAVPVGCCVALGILHGFLGTKRPWAVKRLGQGIVIAGVLYLVAVADFAEPFRDVQMRGQHSSGEKWFEPEYPAALIMNRLLPEGSVIGSWDAGILGYFSHFPVVNLDGVVNSYDYFHATRNTIGVYWYWLSYPQLVQKYGITHFANRLSSSIPPPTSNMWYGHFFDSIMFVGPSTPPFGTERWTVNLWSNFPPQAPAVQFDAAARLWQRLATHADYQSDKVTAIVDGRMAQVFARDCASGQMPHVLAFSWGPNDRRNGLTRYLSAEGENSLGYCARVYFLSKDAAGPVAVEALPLTEFMAFIRESGQRIVRSVFDIYSKDGQLTYIKDPCASADIAHSWFLSVWPLHASDLPEERKQDGFENHSFPFDLYGRRFDGKCIATVSLPNYPIARIRTGQYSEAGELWSAEIR